MDDSLCYCYEESLYRVKIFSHLKNSGFVPEKGSELFVSGIPTEASAGDLRNFFEPLGQIFQIKLLLKAHGVGNRGFGYVCYMNKTVAQEALEKLKNKPFLNKTFLNLKVSVDNCRIFLGNLPLNKCKDQIWKELENMYHIQNILDVITYRNHLNPMYNRGFVFLEFHTHEEACWFRAKFWDKLILFGRKVNVGWANMGELDMDVMDDSVDKVKTVFVHNLRATLDKKDFINLIHSKINPEYVEKIYKFHDYAYINLKSREQAECLMEKLENYYKRTPVEVSFNCKPAKMKPFTDYSSKENKPMYNPFFYKKSMTSTCSNTLLSSISNFSISSSPDLSNFKTSTGRNNLEQLEENKENLEKRLLKEMDSPSQFENNGVLGVVRSIWPPCGDNKNSGTTWERVSTPFPTEFLKLAEPEKEFGWPFDPRWTYD